MLGRVRRHPVASALALLGVTGVILVVAVAWYLLGEARRSGRIVSAVLSKQLGVPVTVERATPEGARRIVLYGVHVPPGAHWSGDVKVRELRVDGGLYPMLFSRGQPIRVVAMSTSITVAEAMPSAVPPTAAALEALRRLAVESAAGPADVSIEVPAARLRTAGTVFSMDLVSRKSPEGTLEASVKIAPQEGATALALDLRGDGRAQGDRVPVRVRIDAQPARLRGLWPTGLPALARASLEGDVVFLPGGDLELKGRMVATPPGDSVPASADLASRYLAGQARLDVGSLALAWGDDMRLSGKATVEEMDRLVRLTFDMRGTADGASVAFDGAYVVRTGALGARLSTGPLDGNKLMSRAGITAMPVDFAVRSTRSTVAGTIAATGARIAVESGLTGLEIPTIFGKTPLDGTVSARAALGRGGGGFELGTLEPSTATLTRSGAPVGVLTARSSGYAAWPIAVDGTLSDLSRVPLADLPARLRGTARLSGSLARASSGTLQFTGDAEADLPRAETTLGGTTVFHGIKIRLPLAWGADVRPARGSAFVERVESYGFTLDRLISSAELTGGRLALPDMKWVHYAGHGWGWLEVAFDGRAVPVRARLEGERIDLATVTREYGLTAAQVTGKVRYLLVMQYARSTGLLVVGQVNSEEGGGQVSIDAIEKLLAAAETQPESNFVLQQTLQNLRVFDYESLEADVRVTTTGGRLNLSLVGKKRLGIFPAPVKAINLRNVPIALLVRLFSRRDAT